MSHFLAASDDFSFGSFFSGIAFSNDSIVISQEGMVDYVNTGRSVFDLTDGRYSLCYKSVEEAIFSTDRTGQDCWFYYSSSDLWIVSNSLYAVAEKLKEKRGVVLLKEQGMLFYHVNHSLGDQLYSDSTMIEGVKVLPRDCFLRASASNLQICQHASHEVIFSEENYIHELRSYVGLWRSRFYSLINLVRAGRARCDVSGGMDSRVVLGLTGLGSSALKVKYSSNKSWESDYRIALLLAKQHGFSIDNSEISVPRSISADESLSLYKYGNAGIYKQVYWPKHSHYFPAIHFHGAGGENIRGLGSGSAWKVVHRLKNHFPEKNSFESFKREYLDWFSSNDIDPKSESSTILHYRSFRGRFHFGRNWFRSLTNPLVTPLSAISLERMGDFMVNNNRTPKDAQFDILYVCNKLLPFFPFDEAGKSFELSTIEGSFSYLPGIEYGIDVKELNVFGEFLDGVERSASGVTDKLISKLAVSEVDYFLSSADADCVNRLSSLCLSDAEKLRTYGLIKMFELL